MNNDFLSARFKELLCTVGLQNFELHLSQLPMTGYEQKYVLGLSKTISLDIPLSSSVVRIEDEFLKIAKNITDDIENSTLAKNLISSKDEEVKKLKEDVLNLSEKVTYLSQFKTHYDLEFTLKHAKDSPV